jgi:hypothetical protein
VNKALSIHPIVSEQQRGIATAPSWAEPDLTLAADFHRHHRRNAVCNRPFSFRIRKTYRHLLIWLLKRSLEKEISWDRFDEMLSAKLDCLAILDE